MHLPNDFFSKMPPMIEQTALTPKRRSGILIAFLTTVGILLPTLVIVVPAGIKGMNRDLHSAILENCDLSSYPAIACHFSDPGARMAESVDPLHLARQIHGVARSTTNKPWKAPVPEHTGRCLNTAGRAFCIAEGAKFQYDIQYGRGGPIPGVPMNIDMVMSAFAGYHDGNPNGTAWQYSIPR